VTLLSNDNRASLYDTASNDNGASFLYDCALMIISLYDLHSNDNRDVFVTLRTLMIIGRLCDTALIIKQ
jgi:hypothetical protein